MKNRALQLVMGCVITIGALSMSGCTKNNDSVGQDETQTKLTSSSSVPVTQERTLSQANVNVSLEAYKEVKDNNELMLTYFALSSKPADYTKILSNYSTEYWNTQSQFEKRDLEEKFRAELDREIGARKDNRYLKLDIKSTWKIKKYDLVKGGFPQTVLSNNSQFGWDNSSWANTGRIAESYFVHFVNGDDFHILKPRDENVARAIEEKLSEELHLIVYGFIRSVDPAQPYLNMQIVKVILIDGAGVQLL